MVLALVLTYLEKIGEGFMSGIGGLLVAPIQEQFKYLCCFDSHITELETKLRDLEATRQVVQMGADEIRRQARDVRPDIEDWLKSVNDVTTDVKRIIQDTEKVEEGCLNGWCSNLKLRYSLSMQAVTKTKVLIDLRDVGVPYTQTLPAYRSPRPGLETITKRDFMRFESRRLNMEEVIKALKHDEINLIGVCGMGGVGKTTMVNEVAKRAKEDNHFDEVAIAVVSQEPNLTNVQACIADMLGLKNLRDMESPIARADRLRKRLLQDNKKVLVILDDVWKQFDLQDMGIPLEGADKNFKVLYTARTRDLWHDLRTKKEIPLEVLSKDEAWQLFREKAGDSADAPDLQPIAKQIVEECGCLPLALVLIGSALSKISGKIYTKDIWEGMLDRLTCVGSTPADNDLSSRLALSYEYLEEEQAKRLFLLCCLFREDEDIRIEDLARYGLGLSLFDGIHEMEKVRHQVFRIVHELKSRCLLLDGEQEKEECVKMHDVVRDMGISIASEDTLVSHGAISQWPKTSIHEHYTFISVISDRLKALPEGLTYPNLKFLMLQCQKLGKLPPNFFEGMGKLKVLELWGFRGIVALQSLRNLTMLSLEGFCGTLDSVSLIGGIPNLEILNFCNSNITELPEEIRELVNLRVLDLRYTYSLTRIPPGILSCLVHLEELYFWGSIFMLWGGEGEEKRLGERNANLREFEFLSNLYTLEIRISSDVLIPEAPIFSKLKIYKVVIADSRFGFYINKTCFLEEKCERVLWVEASTPIPSNRGGIDSLLRNSDWLSLKGEGCNDLVWELLLRDGVNGLQQKKVLQIDACHTPKCLANTTNPVHLPTSLAPAILPVLKQLELSMLPNLREICCGAVPASSFGELTSIKVHYCERLENLFQLSIEGCPTRQEEVHVATNNRIVFPKLKTLELYYLPSLVGFCRGIDQIDFPQLKRLELKRVRRFNCLFHNNCNLSSNSAQNDNVGFLSLFPQEISLPNLEVLEVAKLQNLERIGHVPLSVGSFSKLKEFSVRDCNKLLCVFPSQPLSMLRELQKLTVESCDSLEVVFELEGLESNEPNPEILSPLKFVKLHELPKLNCISKRDPVVFKYIKTLVIHDCNSLRYVFAPTMTKSIPQLRELQIRRCEMLSRIVAEENGLGESSVDEVEFPQLKRLELLDLPNLVSFFPNVNVNGNTTTLAKSTDHYHNTLQPQPLFNEKVAFPSLEYLELSWLGTVSYLWSSELPTSSFSKLKEFSVRDCDKLLCIFPSQLLSMLRELQELTVKRCDSLEVVFELEGLESNGPNPEILSPLKLVKLHRLPKLNCLSKRDPMGFKYIQTLVIHECHSLRYVFAPTMTKSIPQLRGLQIWRCEMLSRIVAEENGLGESSVDEVEFPQLERLELLDLPNLVSFFPNVNVNTITLAKSTDHYHNPLQSQPLFNEKVAFPSLEYLELSWLGTVSYLWSSELPTSSFSKLNTLNVRGFTNLRSTFHHSMVRGLVNLLKLVIIDCSKMEGVVYWEEEIEDGQGRNVLKIALFPLLRILELRSLPNLVSFFPNVNTTTLAKSNDHLYNPMQPRPLFNEKVAIPSLEYLELEGLQNVIDIPTSSFSKLKSLQVTGCTSLRNIPCMSWLGDLNNTTQGLQEVAQLLYTNYGNGVLALGSNGTMKLWDWPSGKFLKGSTTVLPYSSHLATTNDVRGVNLEEVVPCMALSKYNYIISACGGAISLFDASTLESLKTFMPPPPASTFLAFYPGDKDIIAIGMEDSTIRIYNHSEHMIKSELKGHEKRITGLAFSTNLHILVSSGADAQLCIWRIDTWEHLKSVSIQLSTGKACNGDTRVQFHSDQICLLVSHETQLVIYDASKMDRIRQWVPQDVLPAPISFAVYSCGSQLVFTSFCDGNIGVFDANSLTLACRIVPSTYLSPAMLSGCRGQDVYPRVIVAHPLLPNQFAIGFTNGFIVLLEPQESEGKWGLSPTGDNGMLNDRTTSSSNTSNHTPDQNRRKEEKEEVNLDKDEDEDEEDQEECSVSDFVTGN